MQKFSDFVFRARGRSSIWIDPAFAVEPALDKIANPDRLLEQPDCEVIKDQSKIKVGCLTLSLGLSFAVSKQQAFLKAKDVVDAAYVSLRTSTVKEQLQKAGVRLDSFGDSKERLLEI